MTTTVTSKKLPYIAAVQFKESFYEPAPEVGYVYIGRHTAYVDEDSPDNIVDSVIDEKLAWENMIAAKRITGNDVELVIPLNNWTANTKYKQYDDTVKLDELLTGNNSLNVRPMYVYTSDVYQIIFHQTPPLNQLVIILLQMVTLLLLMVIFGSTCTMSNRQINFYLMNGYHHRQAFNS
jgi:hypothetical protein